MFHCIAEIHRDIRTVVSNLLGIFHISITYKYLHIYLGFGHVSSFDVRVTHVHIHNMHVEFCIRTYVYVGYGLCVCVWQLAHLRGEVRHFVAVFGMINTGFLVETAACSLCKVLLLQFPSPDGCC